MCVGGSWNSVSFPNTLHFTLSLTSPTSEKQTKSRDQSGLSINFQKSSINFDSTFDRLTFWCLVFPLWWLVAFNQWRTTGFQVSLHATFHVCRNWFHFTNNRKELDSRQVSQFPMWPLKSSHKFWHCRVRAGYLTPPLLVFPFVRFRNIFIKIFFFFVHGSIHVALPQTRKSELFNREHLRSFRFPTLKIKREHVLFLPH